jgi:hypothetical protein
MVIFRDRFCNSNHVPQIASEAAKDEQQRQNSSRAHENHETGKPWL